ncbi:hypothetical protein F4561_005299 [Lipingzhangella halophila]|uniref:Serine aminopeptidase S33 domain-containing protein n=1 Tax=Lipingzhangella halophila TaxID=1783352 RepID=A0A7W7RM39_9ACTN|nr:alpha/beta hydrolase [Lipingzhangella halophila]MBB4934479.1 hypothetical protein [Lipingzhangella halophila]
MSEFHTEALSFTVGASNVAAVLRSPRGGQRVPGVVLTGPFTGVKEQVVATYAELLSAAGLATLVFDHRGFGGSEGEPRQHEDSTGKLADLRTATSVLAAQSAVDPERLGCVGICLGGGYALRHSAFDPRIRASAFVAAAFNDPRVMREGMGEESYRAAMAEFAALDQRHHDTGEVAYVPAVSPDGGEAAMPGREPWEYYGTERSAAGPGWHNRVTRSSIRELLTFDAAMGADFLAPTPALFVHGRRDDFCSPRAAQTVYDRVRSAQKEFCWFDTTNHIDLYDQPAYVEPAAARVASWFTEHL